MKIELLVFEGCPNREPAEKLVREAVDELDVDADIEIVEVRDNDDAVVKRFLGSPSIRINGRDIEIKEDESTQYSMRCRRYKSESGVEGYPDNKLIRGALLAEIAKGDSE